MGVGEITLVAACCCLITNNTEPERLSGQMVRRYGVFSRTLVDCMVSILLTRIFFREFSLLYVNTPHAHIDAVSEKSFWLCLPLVCRRSYNQPYS